MLSIADYYMTGWRNDAKTSPTKPTFVFNIYFYLVHIYFAFNTNTNLLECTFGLVCNSKLCAAHCDTYTYQDRIYIHIHTHTHSDENAVTID